MRIIMSDSGNCGTGAALIAALVLGSGSALALDASDYATAEKAAREHRLADMQTAYEAILDEVPEDPRALLGRAEALAWQGQYVEAQEVYRRVLGRDSHNVDALTGLGYAQAWNGENPAARRSFEQAIALDTGRLDAHKGIAFTYLWSGQYDQALAAFDNAAHHAPGDDAEIFEARGQTYLAAGRDRDAIAAFDRALAIDPERDVAKRARFEARRSAPALEFNVVAGTTSDAGNGLRRAEIAHALNTATRFSLRYDNSLGLDNVSIADRGDDAQGVFLGVDHRFRSGVYLGVELGQRDHTGGAEDIVGLQTAVPIAGGIWRAGARFGDHEFGHSNSITLRSRRCRPFVSADISGRAAPGFS